MTKQEAIIAMQKGKKVRHKSFMKHEWISIIDDKIRTEEGFLHNQKEFWILRNTNNWLTGWSVILERPNIIYKHSDGPWKRKEIFFDNGDIFQKVTIKNKENICNIITRDEQKALANAKLIAIAPELLQLAEMYFDSMQGSPAEGSLSYKLTLKTLNKLK